MTGSHLVLAAGGSGGSGGSGSSNTPDPLDWPDVYGRRPVSTITLKITGITVQITVSQSRTGTGIIFYVLNGAPSVLYTAPFTVNAGDTLAWHVTESGGTASGVVTVKNDTNSTTLDTFAYTVTP